MFYSPAPLPIRTQVHLPISVSGRSGLSETKTIGREPEDRYGKIRNECYEELVQVAKQLSELSLLFIDHPFVMAGTNQELPAGSSSQLGERRGRGSMPAR